MTTLRPLRNTVMFRFLDSSGGAKGRFTDTHSSGIVLVPSISSQKSHRWGEVLAVGPDCYGLEIGDYILIESLMWMEGTEIDGQKMWKTDDSKILAVTNDLTACQSQAL